MGTFIHMYSLIIKILGTNYKIYHSFLLFLYYYIMTKSLFSCSLISWVWLWECPSNNDCYQSVVDISR